MTDKHFIFCVNEAKNYADRDAYISDLALSTVWGDAPDMGIPSDRIEQLGSIYDAVHRSVKDIAAAAGMSCRKLAERYAIPYRTMEDWCAGKNKCPHYLRMMMQECLGLLKR